LLIAFWPMHFATVADIFFTKLRGGESITLILILYN
jgi:hypothetical protein